jgi:thiopurine S-methyltransferase
MAEDWISLWEQGRTGWHEPAGNAALKKYWPVVPPGRRVLVPLCGKSMDLIWLERRGLYITGIELSQQAVESFFEENGIDYSVSNEYDHRIYCGKDRAICIFCGDYFSFSGAPFDALYDRGALVALPAHRRPEYVRHTEALLKPDAARLVVTLEYEQNRVDGPPFSVPAEELLQYWPGLVRVSTSNDLANSPPKFREAGLKEVSEVTWVSPGLF